MTSALHTLLIPHVNTHGHTIECACGVVGRDLGVLACLLQRLSEAKPILADVESDTGLDCSSDFLVLCAVPLHGVPFV